MGRMTTQIVGSAFYPGAGNWIAKLKPNQMLRLEREPDNKYDKNAIAVYIFEQKLGHLSRGVAMDFAALIDAGVKVKARKAAKFPGNAMIEIGWEDGSSPVPKSDGGRVKPENFTATKPMRPPSKPFFPKVDLE